MKKNKGLKTMVITSIVILIPLVIGLLLWKRLPDRIATHFGLDNQADGWSGKPMAVFGLPLMMLAVQWICFLAVTFDPKRKNISSKMFSLVLWIVPVISLITSLMILAGAIGYKMNIGLIVNVIVGIVFIMLGNYLHKVKQNYTVGVKLPWTLNNEENWNRTNRLSAWIFVIGGVAMIVNAFFVADWIAPVVIAAALIIPTVYSFVLYKKGM